MRKQEQTRLAELAAEKAHFEAIQAQAAIVSDNLVNCLAHSPLWKFRLRFFI